MMTIQRKRKCDPIFFINSHLQFYGLEFHFRYNYFILTEAFESSLRPHWAWRLVTIGTVEENGGSWGNHGNWKILSWHTSYVAKRLMERKSGQSQKTSFGSLSPSSQGSTFCCCMMMCVFERIEASSARIATNVQSSQCCCELSHLSTPKAR